ncbi:hypothetical protein ES288_D07G262900v1 [Gossypium darwinii]|uniref:Uncharacterized protein n=1 Tax=Gossypium darwinii TaxID=34276 RepID=A0A5D2BZU6_GOSDA|nr:hypothetical protein ES288_D07G262900v1 [Gossypium darwinii]
MIVDIFCQVSPLMVALLLVVLSVLFNSTIGVRSSLCYNFRASFIYTPWHKI